MICCCALWLHNCPLLLLLFVCLFSQWGNVCGCCQLTWLPETTLGYPVHSANTPVPQNCCRGRGVSRPKAGPGLALQTSSKQAANGTLIDLPFCPPPPNILHLLGSTVAFPAAPWQQRPLSMGAGRETTFSWCHCAVVNGDQAWSAVPASNL